MQISANSKPVNHSSDNVKVEKGKASQPNRLDEVGETQFVDVCQPPYYFGPRNKSKESPAWHQNLSYYFSQYCGGTSIHGIKYLGERGRFAIEKIVWSIVIAVVCSLCIFLVVNTYNKWITSPVIVTFSTMETGIWKIPFPAVTICPQVKSNPKVFNYTDVMIKKFFDFDVTEEEDRYFDTFSLICSDFFSQLHEDYIDINNFTTSQHVLTDLIMAVSGIDPHNLSNIYWLGKKYESYDMMSLSLTNEGFCYTFNMLHYDEIFKDPEDDVTKRSLPNSKPQKWSLESGYPNDDEDSFPRRTFLSGIDGGFIFDGLFANHSHLDYACTEGLQGFKVTLHHPSELPNMDKHFHVPLDQAVLVAIKPRMIYVTEELKSYKPEARKCYFSDERPLKFFRSYTQQNCLDECLSNFTLAECKCVAFHMPSYVDAAICGPGKYECLQRSKVKYLSNEGNDCNCLPFCTALEYDVEISQSEWKWHELFELIRRLGVEVSDFPFNYKQSHFSKLAVFYKDLQFLASERHELYGYTDFFSNVGGLLGLFIGLSVTSLIEILYFLTLRIVCNIRKFGQDYWSGAPDLVDT